MSLTELQHLFGWSLLINYIILMIWFGMILFARDRVHRFHGRWFEMDRARFDAIQYTLMGLFKLGIILLNLTPFLVLWLIVN